MKRRKIVISGLVTIAIISAVLLGSAAFSSNPVPAANLSTDQPSAAKDQPLPTVADRTAEIRTVLPLFYRIDANYVRGSEPAHGGIDELVRQGTRSVVDLRSRYDRTSEIQIAAERAGLVYYWLPLSVWDPATDEEAKQFISLVTDESKGPFFVFCADGLHRTGEMTAIYRLVKHNWKLERALKEMDEAGFSPYYYSLRNYVWSYARKFCPSTLQDPHKPRTSSGPRSQ